MSKLQEKPSALKREHPALFFVSMFVGHFCPPGSGGSRYGSRYLTESGFGPTLLFFTQSYI